MLGTLEPRLLGWGAWPTPRNMPLLMCYCAEFGHSSSNINESTYGEQREKLSPHVKTCDFLLVMLCNHRPISYISKTNGNFGFPHPLYLTPVDGVPLAILWAQKIE